MLGERELQRKCWSRREKHGISWVISFVSGLSSVKKIRVWGKAVFFLMYGVPISLQAPVILNILDVTKKVK